MSTIHENITEAKPWLALKSLPDIGSKTTVTNPDQAQTDPLKALVTFCPLYAPGSLGESALLPAPATIEGSRVGGKWQALQTVLGGLASHTAATQGEMSLTAVFASKGVLFGTEPTDADHMHLAHHGELYREAIGKLCAAKGIELTFADYHELGVSFPTFVDPNKEVPEIEEEYTSETIHDSEAGKIVATLNQQLAQLNVSTELKQNKSTRQKISALTEAFGPNTAYWLVAGYLAFDYKIPELVGKDGVYLSLERFAPIFRIANLTPGVREMTRVEVSA